MILPIDLERKSGKSGGQELQVHKIEIFVGFDFEICNISLLVMSKYFDLGQKNIFLFFFHF